ncbi:ABC transporter substrate-binding protein [Sesbania bispinosa]|nr:ABC transporter substrate-binding protein [Sesbania bispinosa]
MVKEVCALAFCTEYSNKRILEQSTISYKTRSELQNSPEDADRTLPPPPRTDLPSRCFMDIRKCTASQWNNFAFNRLHLLHRRSTMATGSVAWFASLYTPPLTGITTSSPRDQSTMESAGRTSSFWFDYSSPISSQPLA